MKHAIALLGVVVSMTGWGGGRLALPFEKTVIVKGNDISAEFAVKELNFVVSNATATAFAVARDQESGIRDRGKRRIFVGRSPEAEKILGAAFFEGLQDEESVVMAKGDDLFLVGGGQIGCLYAVYDFVEDNLGFRHYFFWDGGFVVDKTDEVVYSGKETRRRPKFHGFRKDHHDHADEAVFTLRNRGMSRAAEAMIPGYAHPLLGRVPGHGFDPFMMPAYTNSMLACWYYKTYGIEPEFERHPEYFSLDQKGKRIPNAQLCLSNPDCREQLLQNVMKWMRKNKPGTYMVGSNDGHNDRYCWCPGCIALEKKYKSVGGPLFDWILWACPELEKRGIRDRLISTLAYKNWRQTEIAPEGVEKFPDNFDCDAAFLNSDRELKYAFESTEMPDGTRFNRLENLRKWCKLCKHVSYWYYGGSNPAQVYYRHQREMQELYEAGVESVGFCGTGGAYEFGDFTGYICFKLLQDPYVDLEPELKRIFAIKYGPAADKVREYVEVLDACRREAIKVYPTTSGTDAMYAGFSYLKGPDLIRMRTLMDEALVLAKGTPFETNVRIARIGINIWTITGLRKIRATDAAVAAKVDVDALDSETRAAFESALKARYPDPKSPHLKGLRKYHGVARYLDVGYNWRFLKSEALPPELADCPADKVHRFLPPKSAPYFCGAAQTGLTSYADPKAASGWAWSDKIMDRQEVLKKGFLPIEVYDNGSRTWLLKPHEKRIPMSVFKSGEYVLYRLPRMRILSGQRIVFGNNWASCATIAGFGSLFDPTYANKEWDIYLSLRGEGPKFFADADPNAESRIWIDQIFCVDRGVPEGK